jgi:tetratricopeptide (TPR) repeat protein
MPQRLADFLLAASIASVAPATCVALAEEVDPSAKYEDCLLQVQAAPDEAYETAMSWEAMGGGEAAQHCAAVALIGMGHYVEAGQRLEDLANRLAHRGQSDLSLEALAQAGQAWLLAGNLERANAVQTAALEQAPDNVDLLVDRAVTLAEAKNYGDALTDLNRALELAPDRPDILIYRASAERYLGATSAALKDVERALVLEPDNPEGLLERGILRRLGNDLDGARADWQRAATLAEGLPTGDAAQANIAKLELGQD